MVREGVRHPDSALSVLLFGGESLVQSKTYDFPDQGRWANDTDFRCMCDSTLVYDTYQL